jgi:M6 family metalloprotease-like protein
MASNILARRFGAIRWFAYSIVIVCALAGPSAAQAVTYPYPLPSFQRTQGDYSPQVASEDRPLLVIYTQFTDIPRPPNQDAEFVVLRYFGDNGVGFPNAVEYFARNSFGHLTLTPAPETHGRANDGLVIVNVGSSTEFRSKSAGDQSLAQLRAADPYVDFASFDKNNDGALTNNELTIASYVVATPPNQTGCGQTVGTSDFLLDGKSVGRLRLAGTVTDANLLTAFHEIGHAIFDAPDLYGWRVYGFDLYGFTCGMPDTRFFNLGAFTKINLGWVHPTIVTRDGFAEVWDANVYPQSTYILYDPDKGPNDYFIVENRTRRGGTYDGGASDRGLVIWRADGNAPFFDGQQANRPAIEVVRPPSGTTTATEAWDSGDPNTPARTMDEPWRDGTPSNVAVRSIPAASDFMRVYFDVRGPGIMVDPTATSNAVTMVQQNPISFPVMNTGEETDTFRFTLEDLPSGWTVAPQTKTLGAGEQTRATVQLYVPPDTPTRDYVLRASGISTTNPEISSASPITVHVFKRSTKIAYTGGTAAAYSDPARLSARLVDLVSGRPIEDKTMSFALGGQSAATTTGADGIAAPSLTLNQPAASLQVRSSFAGDGTYLPSDTSTDFTINKEKLSFLYTGDALVKGGLGSTPIASAVGMQDDDGSPGDLSLADAVFDLTPALSAQQFSYSGRLTGEGTVSAPASGLPIDLWAVGISASAGNPYWEGSSTRAAELVVYAPSAHFTGEAAGVDSRSVPISLAFDARYQRGRPIGSVSLRFSGGTFSGKSIGWIVQVASQAILQVGGQLNGIPATLRLRVADNAEPGRPDTFSALIGGYDSGSVSVTSGNLQSH